MYVEQKHPSRIAIPDPMPAREDIRSDKMLSDQMFIDSRKV